MGKWLAAFQAEVGGALPPSFRADSAVRANSPGDGSNRDPIGTIGAIGARVRRQERLPNTALSTQTALLARGYGERNAPVRDEQDARDDFEELAARLEHQSSMSRAEAERQAHVDVYGSSTNVVPLDPARPVARRLSDAEVDAMPRASRAQRLNR